MPRSSVCFFAALSTSASVVLPYRCGSRVPRRLRLGPLMSRIDLDISDMWKTL